LPSPTTKPVAKRRSRFRPITPGRFIGKRRHLDGSIGPIRLRGERAPICRALRFQVPPPLFGESVRIVGICWRDG
jgi:hypothetical protein